MRARTAAGQHGGVTTTSTERAGARLALGLAGGLVLAVVSVPVALLVRAEWAPVVDADRSVSRAAEDAVGASDTLLLLARGVTLLGEPVLLTVAAFALAWWLARRGRGRLGVYVLVARLGAMALSSGLKLAVDRARPVFDEPVATALGASFPSGHALGSAAFWGSTAVLLMPYVRRDRLLLAGAALVAVAVAASRVLLGVHYVSDVVGGLLLGWGWVALCTAVFVVERREAGRPVDVAEEGIGR